ncbi:MipA/OmpV family protein [Malikia sp.]|uniref:MipA/OmpV family protein n=1 Tax=Malikia sp. TaxID=2070706 RepID=UPI00262E99F0|nr:MipA/OmpV family protein [Malikia sp.]MDD2729583.1 MipA/OmpV family protein [Malikia sp.]
MKRRITAVLLIAVAWALPGLSAAQDAAQAAATKGVEASEAESDGPVRHYLIGAALASSQGHIGSEGRELGLQPVWGFWAGRYRLSSGRASSLWQVGRETVVDAGLSTTLVSHSDWSLGASLSRDAGRKSGDEPLLAGVPDLRSTLRGKVSVGYAFAPRWSLGLGSSHDLLGRDGGGRYSASLGYRQPLSERAYWDASLSASWGNRDYMRGHYGIPAAAAPRPAYSLDGGIEGMGLGWSFTTAINHNWVAYAGWNLSRLMGDAGRSPVVGTRQVWGASAGVAYRY